MITLNASSSRGSKILNSANIYEGFYLWDVYERCSFSKQRAWQSCYDKFQSDENSENFHICGHCTSNFSIAWKTKVDNENVMRYETYKNSYLIYLDR